MVAGTRSDPVVAHVRSLIERGVLRPGDRLPAERDLASQIGVSRPTVRAGLHALAAMGVVRSRRGSGSYIADGPPALAPEALGFLAALHGFTRVDMYETRRVLEAGAAGLAAVRATPDQLAAMADAVTSLFAVMDAPQQFLVHDLEFHRRVAEGSGNPILATLIETVSALHYEQRRKTASRAARRDLRTAAEAHRRIYQAIRARDPEAAREAMHDHLVQASRAQAQEGNSERDGARARRRKTAS